MPRKMSSDKLEALIKRREELDAQIQVESARRKDEQRKADARRKIIVGALAIEHMDKNPTSDFAVLLLRLMDEYVTRPRDRALFPALPEAVEASEATQTLP